MTTAATATLPGLHSGLLADPPRGVPRAEPAPWDVLTHPQNLRRVMDWGQ
jgi:hypothetical protein